MIRFPLALSCGLALAGCAAVPLPGTDTATACGVGGYRFAWGDTRIMESYPIQVATELRPIAPAGPATQALVTHDVRGEFPVTPPVGSVTVRCGGRVLAAISPVETAH
jgi:hypothetical protein